jgi:hypothetical protein
MACKDKVKVTYDAKENPIKWELICEGTCADGTACKNHPEVPDPKLPHTTREFCACKAGKDDESTDCHIVIYRVKPPKGNPDTYFKCEGAANCKKGQTCAPAFVPHPVVKGAPVEWREFTCECQSDDDV